MMNRREFAKISSFSIVAIAAGFGISSLFKSEIPKFLRPPGALEEDEFLASCIKCGQCVQVCPYFCINLLDITDGLSIGTPFIDATKRGCYLCDLFPCILACPSGALNHDVSEISDVHMGIAKINNQTSCISSQKLNEEQIYKIVNVKTHNERELDLVKKAKNLVGQNCNLCVDFCPLSEFGAILIVDFNPRINQSCVGCGVCVEVCPIENLISIIPRKLYEEV